jgi:(4-alkanoyl-5-oxo-2,5-dihydrofuran-3-yl)methyl phosphate reductase
MALVLVCGATGNTGSEVLRQLVAQGVPTRAMTRSPESARRLSGSGVDTVVADLGSPDSLPAALEGVTAVYVATPTSPELPRYEGNLAAAAARAGVSHIVKLSVIGAAAESPLTFARLHFDAEQRIRQSGLHWTMVRPNGFMQNTLAWAPQIAAGDIYGPIMDARWSIVDMRDIAAVAVAALTDPATHSGATYVVTGPEASSPREQIEILAETLGRPLEAHEVSIEQARAAMLDSGWPAWNAERMTELLHLYANGVATATSPDVERVTGHTARSYRQFAADHRDAFLGRAA